MNAPDISNPRPRLVAGVLLAALACAGCGRCDSPAPDRADAPSAPPAAAEDAPSEVFRTFRAPSMATTVEVVLPDTAEASAQARLVFSTFEEVDARMSEWKPSSPLSRVNANAGEAVEVPGDLRGIIERGVEIGELTDGAFDITWAALWGLWDFKAEDPAPPSEEAIAERVARVDFRKVEIDEEAGTVRLQQEGMKLGLGGIAKGHALDQSARRLRRAGVEDFLISAGGQIMAEGHRGERPWRVGVRDPRGRRGEDFAHVEVSGGSVSTSGDYERYFFHEGVRYHHILNPGTGRPARGLRSATVLSKDATLADALSTACMVMGRERALELAEGLEGVEVLLVDQRGEVIASEGMKAKVVVKRPPREGGP